MITIEINDISMHFDTAPTMFSPNKIDAGTAAMLSCVNFSPSDKVLDLGCGYGVVGIYAAKLIGDEHVTMTDINKLYHFAFRPVNHSAPTSPGNDPSLSPQTGWRHRAHGASNAR